LGEGFEIQGVLGEGLETNRESGQKKGSLGVRSATGLVRGTGIVGARNCVQGNELHVKKGTRGTKDSVEQGDGGELRPQKKKNFPKNRH